MSKSDRHSINVNKQNVVFGEGINPQVKNPNASTTGIARDNKSENKKKDSGGNRQSTVSQTVQHTNEKKLATDINTTGQKYSRKNAPQHSDKMERKPTRTLLSVIPNKELVPAYFEKSFHNVTASAKFSKSLTAEAYTEESNYEQRKRMTKSTGSIRNVRVEIPLRHEHETQYDDQGNSGEKTLGREALNQSLVPEPKQSLETVHDKAGISVQTHVQYSKIIDDPDLSIQGIRADGRIAGTADSLCLPSKENNARLKRSVSSTNSWKNPDADKLVSQMKQNYSNSVMEGTHQTHKSDSGARPKEKNARSNSYGSSSASHEQDRPAGRSPCDTSSFIDVNATNESIVYLDVDVIVSSDDSTLRSGGMVAQVIAKQGGDLLEEYKKCIRQMCPHISTWTLQPTPAIGISKCKHVFHAVVKPFSKHSQIEWIDGLQSLITEILYRTDHMGYESLAVPLLGTGKNGAPTDLVIDLLCETIEKYAGKPRPICCLQSVTIVHPSKNIKDEIKKALQFRSNFSSKQKPKIKEKTSKNTKEIFLTVDGKLKENCPICLEKIKGSNLRQLSRCSHLFCKKCITESFKRVPTCPLCNMVYGEITGTQPQGLMVEAFLRDVKLPGYDKCGTICIMYLFEGGIQLKEHPNPGRQYKGTKRTAYLPDNADGQKVHRLLRKAFSQRLVFTIGSSRTTGKEDVVTWNDIHHKTNIHGGTAKFGYPDPDYLSRVLDELAAKGITED